MMASVSHIYAKSWTANRKHQYVMGFDLSHFSCSTSFVILFYNSWLLLRIMTSSLAFLESFIEHKMSGGNCIFVYLKDNL